MVGSWFYVHALDMSPSRLRKSLVVRGMKEREKSAREMEKEIVVWCVYRRQERPGPHP